MSDLEKTLELAPSALLSVWGLQGETITPEVDPRLMAPSSPGALPQPRSLSGTHFIRRDYKRCQFVMQIFTQAANLVRMQCEPEGCGPLPAHSQHHMRDYSTGPGWWQDGTLILVWSEIPRRKGLCWGIYTTAKERWQNRANRWHHTAYSQPPPHPLTHTAAPSPLLWISSCKYLSWTRPLVLSSSSFIIFF